MSPTEPGASSSNVTVRAVNGTTFVSGHTNRRFTIGGCGNRYALESGSLMKIPTIVTGYGNHLGVTNAAIATDITIQGTNNTVVFSSSVACTPGFKDRCFGISGLGNQLVFEDSAATNDLESVAQSIENIVNGTSNLVSITGSSAALYLGAIGIYGTNNVVSIADNLVVSNAASPSAKMCGFPMRPLFKSGSVNSSVLVGTNAVARFWHWSGMPRGATNALLRIGRGSSVYTMKQDVDKASTLIGGPTGAGNRILLEGGSFEIAEGQWPTVVTGGVSIAFSGDSPRFRISSSNAGNYGFLQITGVADGLEPPRLIFRPGSGAFGGEAPVSVQANSRSWIAPTTVFDVDVTEFARRKPSGTYDIPLVKKARGWSRCDADALTSAGVFTPANGRLTFNDDGDLVFRFKRDCGTRLMLR